MPQPLAREYDTRLLKQPLAVHLSPSGGIATRAIAALDIHTGTPEEVIASLQADSALARASDWSVQVHSIDPPHPHILRSIELVAQVVAPALGWQPAADVANLFWRQGTLKHVSPSLSVSGL